MQARAHMMPMPMPMPMAVAAAAAEKERLTYEPHVADAHGDNQYLQPQSVPALERDPRRRLFMKMLRRGVQEKMRSEQLRGDASDADCAASTRDSLSSMASTCSPSSVASSPRPWQALSWRNAQSMEPFFEETVRGQCLRVKQLLQGEVTGFGTGLTVWPAACVLLKHLEHRCAMASTTAMTTVDAPSPFANQLVVELGSGTGAVGIAAAMLGAARVVLTDIAKLRFLMQANVEMAQALMTTTTDVQIDVATYEWGATPGPVLLRSPAEDARRQMNTTATTTIPLQPDDSNSRAPDLVLISDCILPKLYPIEPLVEALDQLCGAHTTVLISYEYRYYQRFDPKTVFWAQLTAKGFTIHELAPHEYHPHFRADDIEIWEARRDSTSCNSSISSAWAAS